MEQVTYYTTEDIIEFAERLAESSEYPSVENRSEGFRQLSEWGIQFEGLGSECEDLIETNRELRSNLAEVEDERDNLQQELEALRNESSKPTTHRVTVTTEEERTTVDVEEESI